MTQLTKENEQCYQEGIKAGRKELAKEIKEIIASSGANPYNALKDIENHIGG